MNKRIRAFQLISTILVTFSISILMGQWSSIKAQSNQSRRFFDTGRQEFEREAENLQQHKQPDSKPLLTIDEEPSVVEEVPASNERLGPDDMRQQGNKKPKN